jgi:hypothetical protein
MIDISAQVINPPKLISETEENGYTIKKLLYPFSRDCDEYGYQFQIAQDSIVLIESRIWPFMDMWDFCRNWRMKSPACHFKDINSDGIVEVMFNYRSGGNDGTEDLEIYSIDSTGRRIAFFNGLENGCGLYWMKELDGDSIPEICTYSRHYECWKDGCAGSRAPVLAWKWDGGKYRMANWKLSDSILRIINKIDPDSVVIKYAFNNKRIIPGVYDPEDNDKYPLWLLGIMLDLIYAGQNAKADSVFNICWPDSLPYKDDFYIEAINRTRDDPFWQEIQDSDW